MSVNLSTAIETDGYCINKFLDRTTSSRSNTEAQKLKQTAINIVENCVNVYSHTFGSGDVGATGTDNTWLGKQTANRFKIQLEGGPVVYDWDQWRRDPIGFGNKLRDYMEDTGVVLVSTWSDSQISPKPYLFTDYGYSPEPVTPES